MIETLPGARLCTTLRGASPLPDRACGGGRAAGFGFHAVAVATVGLSNRIAAGCSAARPWVPSTINTIVVVEADPEPHPVMP